MYAHEEDYETSTKTTCYKSFLQLLIILMGLCSLTMLVLGGLCFGQGDFGLCGSQSIATALITIGTISCFCCAIINTVRRIC